MASRVSAHAADGDDGSVEASCADDDSVVAGVADQHAVDLGIAAQEGLDAGEVAGVLVGVEEDKEASAELVGELLEVGGQMAEDRDGDLTVGGAAAVQPAVDDARFGRRVVPDTEIAEWRGVQAGIGSRWDRARRRGLRPGVRCLP